MEKAESMTAAEAFKLAAGRSCRDDGRGTGSGGEKGREKGREGGGGNMTYRERLKKYRDGLLEEAEREAVAQEIEKHEAISDYLYMEEEIPEFGEVFGAEGAGAVADTDFVAVVNRSIRRAFLKLGAAVLVVSVALIFVIQFLLPRAVSLLYYDPGMVSEDQYNQMSRDMAVYSELYLPCRRRDYVTVDAKGYGRYDIDIRQNVSLDGRFTTVSGEITRGKLRLYIEDQLKRPTGNCFAWCQVFGDLTRPLTELEKEMNKEVDGQMTYSLGSAAGDRAQALEFAQALSEEEKYIGYVSLNRMMPYEDFTKWVNSLDVGELWCAVQTSAFDDFQDGEQSFHASNTGFVYQQMSSTSFLWDEEKYPKLFQWNVRSEGEESWLEKNTDGNKEADMTAHFTSMLRYLADQEQFTKMMGLTQGGWMITEGEDSAPGDALRAAADYVEQNGLTIYGFASVMDKELVLELMELPEVYSVYTEYY